MAKRQYTYDYPRPMVTVDGALFRIVEGDLQVLLIKRKKPPFKGRWALPGGFIQMNESLEDSALRELAEETGIRQIRLLTQLGAYGDPKRDPRGPSDHDRLRGRGGFGLRGRGRRRRGGG